MGGSVSPTPSCGRHQVACGKFGLHPPDPSFALESSADRKFNVLLQSNLVDQIFALKPIWDGDVTLPNEPAPNNRYRLVIAEYEEYLIDDDRPYDRVPTKKERRLVFIEHVELG